MSVKKILKYWKGVFTALEGSNLESGTENPCVLRPPDSPCVFVWTQGWTWVSYSNQHQSLEDFLLKCTVKKKKNASMFVNQKERRKSHLQTMHSNPSVSIPKYVNLSFSIFIFYEYLFIKTFMKISQKSSY